MRIISGKYGRRRFDVPTNITARPTTDMARENLFNVLNNIVDFEGMTALDLFSGTGAISFELLSRGCASVTSVEKASTQYNFISKVKSLLKEENLVQIRGDVFKFIATCTRKFDLIFADPPYALENLDQLPDLIFNHNLLTEDGIFILEHPREYQFENHPHFWQHRNYGKVNFTFFANQLSPEE